MDDVYGMWYGVGYAQHTPDMTDKPIEVGCISLYINDATGEQHDDWLNWSVSTFCYLFVIDFLSSLFLEVNYDLSN